MLIPPPPTRWVAAYGLLLGSACFAAAGQVLFKMGATNRTSILALINPHIVVGSVLYLMGAGLWVGALVRLPLTVAYPFSALTFVLVYLASVLLLGERPSPGALAGVALVLGGLGVILWSR
jgi:undecaprenyl phosphate-alpha-L-ara4N flippase subunit ArnE